MTEILAQLALLMFPLGIVAGWCARIVWARARRQLRWEREVGAFE